MRKNKIVDQQKEFSILALDDDKLMTETIQSYFQTAGYRVDTENDPTKAADRIRTKQYDILLLDFLMRPICGDEVVRQIREFDHDLFIILLTGHKSMAPPIRTIRELDIQGYFEKSERFDQLELLIESCAKSIRQMRTIRSYRDGLQKIFELIPVLNCQQSVDEILSQVLKQVSELIPCQSNCVYLDFAPLQQKFTLDSDTKVFRGTGAFEGQEQFGAEIYQNLAKGDLQIAVDPDKHLLIAPLFTEGHQLFGSLVAQLSEKVKDEASQLFEVYSKQVGSIVSNQLLHYLLEEQNKKLKEQMREQQERLRQYAHEYLLMGNECITQAHDARAAIANYDKALSLDPNYIDAWIRKGITLFNSKEYFDAENCFNTAVSLHPANFKAVYNRGKLRLKIDNTEGAIADLDKATSLKPEHAGAHELFGDALLRVGKEVEAAIQWRIAEELRKKKS